MAAPSYAFDVARSLLNEADELLADARRINDIADRINDTMIGNELKIEVRRLVALARELVPVEPVAPSLTVAAR